jgi:hypothetical protein
MADLSKHNIVRREVKTYREHWMCPRDDGGEMLPTGLVFTTMPPAYEHRCMRCGFTETTDDRFPRVVYVDA